MPEEFFGNDKAEVFISNYKDADWSEKLTLRAYEAVVFRFVNE